MENLNAISELLYKAEQAAYPIHSLKETKDTIEFKFDDYSEMMCVEYILYKDGNVHYERYEEDGQVHTYPMSLEGIAKELDLV